MSAYVTAEQFEAVATVIGQRLKTRARKVTGLIGDGAAVSIDFVHNLNTYDVQVQLVQAAAPRGTRIPNVERPSLNVVRLKFDAGKVPALNEYRVIVIG